MVQRRNDQLKAQLADTESLLQSHQDQLAELKQVMEHMNDERDDQTNPTTPSTPGLNKYDSKDESSQDAEALRSATIPETVSPSYPTSFTHILHTVLRTDLSAYDDFTSLLRMSKHHPTGSRVSSGSYGSIGLGLGLGGYAPATTQQGPTNGSSTSLSTTGTVGSSPATPTTPASSVSAGSTNGPNALTPLKETKFYKRVVAEDIEPTLRLDSAPGLSWLARRTVLNTVCEGSLVVEPMPASVKHFVFSCSLCGETRKDPPHIRSHRFRTSENENAQRYPLCKYCLGRVRSTCDFSGFLRILKDGHWRSDDEESERSAWEESVRLREQMFWCRVGGGVVPVHHNHGELRSPRMSEDERKEQERKLSEELGRTGEIQPKDITPVPEPTIDATKATSVRRMSKVAVRDDTAEGLWQAAQEDAAVPNPIQTRSQQAEAVEPTKDTADEETTSEKRDTTRDSLQSAYSLQVASGDEGEKEGKQRLSVTIPASFE